jgi:hypothetical protein
VLVCVLLSSIALHAQTLSKQDAVRFQTKLETIKKNALATAAKGAAKGKTRSTQVSDGEVNAYLKFLAGADVPVGIVDPTLHAAGNGLVTGRAMVDLDAVRTQKKRGWTDPLGYLMGRLPVTPPHADDAERRRRSSSKSAEISGVTVPKSLLQELLSYYSRTTENPAGINMDEPFQLPPRIREITIGQGTATIVQ